MAASPAGVNGSQFFVLLGDAPHLASGTYNRFGSVDSGMDVVRKLAIGDRIIGVDVTAK
jgi:cyclophilin family peptidyl-prolyl cis-trans isomerase